MSWNEFLGIAKNGLSTIKEDAKKKDAENSKLSQETNELPPSDTNISESTFSKLDEWKKTHPLTDKKQSEDLEGKSFPESNIKGHDVSKSREIPFIDYSESGHPMEMGR